MAFILIIIGVGLMIGGLAYYFLLLLQITPEILLLFGSGIIVLVGLLLLLGGIFLIGQMYGFWIKVMERITRPVTSVVLGICFGIAFWSIPFFIVANYVLLPEFLMLALLGLVAFFQAWGPILSVVFFIFGFVLGFLLLYSTSRSASY
jgi:hypothetical protein